MRSSHRSEGPAGLRHRALHKQDTNCAVLDGAEGFVTMNDCNASSSCRSFWLLEGGGAVAAGEMRCMPKTCTTPYLVLGKERQAARKQLLLAPARRARTFDCNIIRQFLFKGSAGLVSRGIFDVMSLEECGTHQGRKRIGGVCVLELIMQAFCCPPYGTAKCASEHAANLVPAQLRVEAARGDHLLVWQSSMRARWTTCRRCAPCC